VIEVLGFWFNLEKILPQISLIPQVFIDFKRLGKTACLQRVQLYLSGQALNTEKINP
jgi:hypothetical protein